MFARWTSSWSVSRKRLTAMLLGGLILIAVSAFFLFWWPSLIAPNSTSPTPEAAGNLNQNKNRDGLTEKSPAGNVGDTADTPAPTATSEESGAAESPAPGALPPTPATTQPTLTTVMNSKSLGAVVFDSVTATCPSGTVAVGGGFRGAESSRFFASYLTGNGWYVRAVNGTLSSSNIYAYVQCVANIRGLVNVTTATTSIATAGNGTVNKDCPSGSTVISGGFDNTQNELAITFSNRVNNGWRVNADSSVLSSQSLKVLTNCYSGGNVSVTQILETAEVPAGWTGTKEAACSSGLTIMGGFASSAQAFSSYFMTISSKWKTAVYNRGSSTTNMKAYTYCATFS